MRLDFDISYPCAECHAVRQILLTKNENVYVHVNGNMSLSLASFTEYKQVILRVDPVRHISNVLYQEINKGTYFYR